MELPSQWAEVPILDTTGAHTRVGWGWGLPEECLFQSTTDWYWQSCLMKSLLSRSTHQERLDSGLLQPLQMSTGWKCSHILSKAMFHLKTFLLYASLSCAVPAHMPLSSTFFPSWTILGLMREAAWDWTLLLITKFNFHDSCSDFCVKISPNNTVPSWKRSTPVQNIKGQKRQLQIGVFVTHLFCFCTTC